MNDSIVGSALSNCLEPEGFRRHRQTWHRNHDDVVEVVNLQKSQWSERYYLNIGIWLRALGTGVAPMLITRRPSRTCAGAAA
jgi:hypothetical protein